MIATLGSKEGLANLAQAITAPGDVVLCPKSDLFGFIISGAVIRSVPFESPSGFFDMLERGAACRSRRR